MKKNNKKPLVLSDLTSILRKDFLTLIQFDDYVLSHIEYPVNIKYMYQGKKEIFSPDFKVIFKPSKISNSKIIPIIAQIIHSKDLTKNSNFLEHVFKAATEYAFINGIEFKVLTEEQIKTPFFYNAKFLRQYRNFKINQLEDVDLIVNTISNFGITNPWKAVLYSVRKAG